jgi:hypothetical protein
LTGLGWNVSTHRLRGFQLPALVFGLIVIGSLNPGEAFEQTAVPRQLGKLEVLSGPLPCEGGECYDLLIKKGSPLIRKTVVPDVNHAGPSGLYASANGVRTVRDILLGECRPRTH